MDDGVREREYILPKNRTTTTVLKEQTDHIKAIINNVRPLSFFAG